jgi:TRAP-type uncharacterized transport system fused permease subunit
MNKVVVTADIIVIIAVVEMTRRTISIINFIIATIISVDKMLHHMLERPVVLFKHPLME